MQRNRRNIQLKNAHILHDERVHARVVKFMDVAPRRLQLVVVQDGVDGHKNAGAVAMRKRGEPCNVRNGVVCLRTRPECRPADVHRVRAVQHRLAPDLGIAGRG
jgi:hypothetical protein